MPDRTRHRVAFVTWSGEPQLSEDDAIAAETIRRHGIAVEAAAWDLSRDWHRYDAIVLRTTWNYHRAADSFSQWTAQAASAGWPLWNPPDVLRWNMHKQYLRDLAVSGASVPETVFVRRGDMASLGILLQRQGWTKAVVKPSISANAYKTTLVEADHAATAERAFAAAVAERDMMVQEFVPEISAGELSLMFFGGCFSHAVRKRPAPGEFRVQESHGGTNESFEPDAATIQTCERLLASVPGPTLYARVDGVQARDTFVVLEIEAIEPSLFFASDIDAAERFSGALLTKLGQV